MSEEAFDMSAALTEISDGLGLEEERGDGGDLDLGDDVDTGNSATTGAEGAQVAVGEGDAVAATKTGEAPAEGAAKTEAPATGEPANGVPPAVGAPRTWRADAAAEWAKIPPVVQAEINKREEDMFHGLEAYKQDAGFGKTIQRVLSPYADVLAQHKIDPITHINTLMNAHYNLSQGAMPARVEALQRIMADCGITIDHLTGLAEGSRVDPEVATLRERLNALESGVQQQTQAQYQASLEQNQAKVNTFAADPKNVHFDAVSNDIVTLLKTGTCKTLEEAYEKAVWMNPITRAAEQARQQAERDLAAKTEEGKRVQKAKEAKAVNLKTGSRNASSTAPLGTIEEEMVKTLAAIKAREA
jgi:hypothetical protein